jgi:hypothetical protein
MQIEIRRPVAVQLGAILLAATRTGAQAGDAGRYASGPPAGRSVGAEIA